MVTWIAATVRNPFWGYAAFLIWVVLIFIGSRFWYATLEIKRAMKRSKVTVTGSKYSFKNPLSYEWEA
jgi:hypothetical protein